MANKKRLFLNVVFWGIIVLTFIYYTYEFLYYKNELETASQMYGNNYYISELLMMVVPVVFLITVAIETSIYFNVRYFIIGDNKTTIKTVFNVLMLMLTVSFVITGIALPEGYVFCFFVIPLLVMRIVYAFIKNKR